MPAELCPNLPGDTPIPSLANRLGGYAFARQPFYRSPQGHGGEVAQIVGATVQADASGQGNNRYAARAQNAVDLVQTAIIGGQVLEHAEANHMVKAGVRKRQ
jgi:hypothetical protein